MRDYDEEADEEGYHAAEEYVEDICYQCSGSGIGMSGPIESSTCLRCRGSGVLLYPREECEEYEEDYEKEESDEAE
jgi:DnaJ-class molecular chaperone